MLCDANGAPLHFLLSGGQASDISYAQSHQQRNLTPLTIIAPKAQRLLRVPNSSSVSHLCEAGLYQIRPELAQAALGNGEPE